VTGDQSDLVEVDLVQRSRVPAGREYTEYRQFLRRDFFYSCAYCTLSEAEAMAVRFTIDHYEAQTAREDLKNDYSNLFYCCSVCNERKGNRTPTADARAEGLRYTRIDEDRYFEHFEHTGIRVNGVTKAGYFTEEAIDLNRQHLRKIRELRERFLSVDRHVALGLRGLRAFRLDRLPPGLREPARRVIIELFGAVDQAQADIDEVLRERCASFLLDEPTAEDIADNKARLKRLRDLQQLYPGEWRPKKEVGREE
jgi:hypothetical protein